MSSIEVREEVHELIDQVDDKFLNAVHSMLETYVQQEQGYGNIDNPISATEMKNLLQEEVEKARQGQYITLDEWHEKSEKWQNQYTK
jgi:DNA phosphorothioation-dependent restriction protein DptG